MQKSSNSAKKISFFLFLVAPAFLIQGCSLDDSLDRDTSAKLIAESSVYPRQRFSSFVLRSYMYNFSSKPAYADVKRQFEEAELGLGVISTMHVSGKTYRHEIELKPNEKLVHYIRDEDIDKLNRVFEGDWGGRHNGRVDIDAVTHLTYLGEITGIVFLNAEKTRARVEYTEIEKPTPFASLLKHASKADRIKNRSANFRKYDDGWRVVN